MTSNARPSHDEFELLRAAVFSVQQFDREFACKFWNVTPAAVKRRLARLEKRGVITSRNVLAAKPPPTDEPLCYCKPDEPPPNCGHVSYQARRRWQNLPVQVTRVYTATKLGRAIYGREPVKPPRDIQATHDLGLASTFLTFRRRWPKLTERCWRCESEYAHHRGHGVKLEDAMLVNQHRVLLLVDFAGSYRADRIEELVQHAAEHNLPIAIY